jgi:hypothetical protein
MTTPTDADTQSPWYECFETQAMPALTPAVAELLADLLAEAGGNEDVDAAVEYDGSCAQALFDYYNA